MHLDKYEYAMNMPFKNAILVPCKFKTNMNINLNNHALISCKVIYGGNGITFFKNLKFKINKEWIKSQVT